MKTMITMGSTTSTRDRASPSLLAVAVVSMVLGILGMHALNTHGVMSNTDHASMTTAVSTPMSGSATDMSAAPLTNVAAGVAGVASLTVPGGGNGHDMGDLGDMVMLCVAMLAAVAGALLVLLRRLRYLPRVWAHLPGPITVTKRITTRQGTGPPPVWEFSVIRC